MDFEKYIIGLTEYLTQYKVKSGIYSDGEETLFHININFLNSLIYPGEI
jgi:hypothetical protein